METLNEEKENARAALDTTQGHTTAGTAIYQGSSYRNTSQTRFLKSLPLVFIVNYSCFLFYTSPTSDQERMELLNEQKDNGSVEMGTTQEVTQAGSPIQNVSTNV